MCPHMGRGQRMGPWVRELSAANSGPGPGNTEGVRHRGQGAMQGAAILCELLTAPSKHSALTDSYCLLSCFCPTPVAAARAACVSFPHSPFLRPGPNYHLPRIWTFEFSAETLSTRNTLISSLTQINQSVSHHRPDSGFRVTLLLVMRIIKTRYSMQ